MVLMENKKREELEKLIDTAIKKVKGSKENDLCKYLPGSSDGYMHHFTLRKLKNSAPDQLFAIIKKFVIETETPRVLNPKQRAPRGSRKQNAAISFTRADVEKILELARQVGDKDLMAKFGPKRSLPLLKKELVRSIRKNRVSQDLWDAYCSMLCDHKE